MKKLTTLAIVFLGLGISAQAQQSVSNAVVNQFTKLYADAEDIEWEDDDDGNLVAYFNLNDNYVQATFSKNAKWLNTSTFIDDDSLPASVKTAVQKVFTGDFFYTEVEKMETPDNLQYKVEIETDDATFQVLFDKDGKLLKKEKISYD